MASEGELMIDHRASPGIPEDMARRVGLPPKQLGEGSLFEAAILRCNHCSTPQIKNLNRIRPRYSCAKCNFAYVCDNCAATMTLPQYVHRTIDEISDMVRSGRWIVSGSTSAPVMIEVPHHG